MTTSTKSMTLEIGDKVKFIGFSAASFYAPAVKIGDIGTVKSVKGPSQFGWDLWVQFPNELIGVSKTEIEKL